MDLSKHSRDGNSVKSGDTLKSCDSDSFKSRDTVMEAEANPSLTSERLPVLTGDTLSSVPIESDKQPSNISSVCDFEDKQETKTEVPMATAWYTGEVSMGTSEFVATVEESALPPLNVTPVESVEIDEQLSEIDRRLREKLKREREKERKRKEETITAESSEGTNVESSLQPELVEQKVVVPSSGGLPVKTSVRYTEGMNFFTLQSVIQ